MIKVPPANVFMVAVCGERSYLSIHLDKGNKSYDYLFIQEGLGVTEQDLLDMYAHRKEGYGLQDVDTEDPQVLKMVLIHMMEQTNGKLFINKERIHSIPKTHL